MEGHHCMICHEHHNSVGRVFLFTCQFHQFLETGVLGNHTSERCKPTLDKRILKRLCNGLGDLVASIPVNFHHLAKTKHQRCHDGKTAESLTQICGGFKIHSKPQEVVICQGLFIRFRGRRWWQQRLQHHPR